MRTISCWFRDSSRWILVGCCLVWQGALSVVSAAPPPLIPRTATRVFWQDDAAKVLKWADLVAGDALELKTAAPVLEWPSLNAQRQTLVQMETTQGWLLIGVRDDADGKFQSGWILVDTGVEEEEHDDHSHWRYRRPPRVVATQLDDQQGNPAHLYCYDAVFYLANDKRNGYTRLAAAEISPQDDIETIRRRATFHQGGGGHITLAAVHKSLGYATWPDREGPQAGRVDVTRLSPQGNTLIAGSFQLPSGGLHGATVNQGKVFFAPLDGICWVSAQPVLAAEFKAPEIQHLSLGQDGDRPRRTGAFTNFGRHVGFVSGRGPEASLCVLDAAHSRPVIQQISLKMAEGNRPAGLTFVQPRTGAALAFVFHDHAVGVDAPYRMSVIEVDPNSDQDWSDARIAQELDVGRSLVEGHAGHHSLAVDGARRRALFTNPGDGELAVYSLDERRQIQKFQVGGVPSKVLAVGGRDSGD